MERRKTRLMTAVEQRALERIENTECYNDCVVYAVEVPAVEHKKVEMIEAKEK